MDHSFERLQENRAPAPDEEGTAPLGGAVILDSVGDVSVTLYADGSVVGLPDGIRVFPVERGFVAAAADGWLNETFESIDDAVQALVQPSRGRSQRGAGDGLRNRQTD